MFQVAGNTLIGYCTFAANRILWKSHFMTSSATLPCLGAGVIVVLKVWRANILPKFATGLAFH